MNQIATQNIALVTGAGRGLGSVIAIELAQAGYRIAATDIDEASASVVAKQIEDAGGEAVALKLNVKSKDDFDNALSVTREKWGGVGVLVNNAGITKTTPIFEISAEEFSEVTDINLRGTFFGCQVFGRYFADRGYGRIINLASLAAQNGGAATGAHYAASKGGIVTLTKVFARDLAQHGVTVNAISPGPLDVDLVHEMIPADHLARLIKNIPTGELGNPVFIAKIVSLIASPAASSMTGSTIDANGGLYVR